MAKMKNDETSAQSDTDESAPETPAATTTEEPAEFPVTLGEFLSEIHVAKVETKAGFTSLCRAENITGRKLRGEWDQLFKLFETKPVKVSWNEWQTRGGK